MTMVRPWFGCFVCFISPLPSSTHLDMKFEGSFCHMEAKWAKLGIHCSKAFSTCLSVVNFNDDYTLFLCVLLNQGLGKGVLCNYSLDAMRSDTQISLYIYVMLLFISGQDKRLEASNFSGLSIPFLPLGRPSEKIKMFERH